MFDVYGFRCVVVAVYWTVEKCQELENKEQLELMWNIVYEGVSKTFRTELITK
jgi:hypothetical protein